MRFSEFVASEMVKAFLSSLALSEPLVMNATFAIFDLALLSLAFEMFVKGEGGLNLAIRVRLPHSVCQALILLLVLCLSQGYFLSDFIRVDASCFWHHL